ncbi:rod shape-determining protein MreC [Prochlorococcus marinus]|uniref:Cell shape-determining protein MreC n=1 Tax=Prochlorococcus marinus (strain MIT 9211) TaxID=93059 RepID=A9BD65_PROM4|nr:rod shape-determining protein MreC [Prochlorococcus marinus]ABX09678.1 putative rod shape-determining protein [Prochlorococcus marinus str. MIT 9211]
MGLSRRTGAFRWWNTKGPWLWCSIAIVFFIIRLSKGFFLIDFYAFLTRPFWPGMAQKEWITNSVKLDNQIRLHLLEQDNQRLRNLLDLKNSSNKNHISAAVISRKPSGFWQQLDLNKGQNDQVKTGDAVIGPGGLLGIIETTTPMTSRVRLLTAPGSQIGVWIERTKVHGVLVGNGNNRPQLNFLDRRTESKIGDVVTTSPASTLLPPNLPIGVIQFKNDENLPAPFAFVQLLAVPEAIDWVQVIRN